VAPGVVILEETPGLATLSGIGALLVLARYGVVGGVIGVVAYHLAVAIKSDGAVEEASLVGKVHAKSVEGVIRHLGKAVEVVAPVLSTASITSDGVEVKVGAGDCAVLDLGE